MPLLTISNFPCDRNKNQVRSDYDQAESLIYTLKINKMVHAHASVTINKMSFSLFTKFLGSELCMMGECIYVWMDRVGLAWKCFKP
jgi:hypothetical protein